MKKVTFPKNVSKNKIYGKKTFSETNSSTAENKSFRNKLFHVKKHIKDGLQADETDQAHIKTQEFGKGFADEKNRLCTYSYT